jgi:hypothetical protein
VATFSSALTLATQSYIASYNCWVKTYSETDSSGSVVIPAIGCILGAGYLRAPSLQGDFAHIPPAGIDSGFVDILDCYPNKISQGTLDLYTQYYYVNSVKFSQGIGFYIATSRTMSSNSLYQSAHIRILTNYYKTSLLLNTKFAEQKPNTIDWQNALYGSILSFFRTEYNNGALETSVGFDTAVNILINKPTSLDRKVLNITIEYIPSEAIESIVLYLNRNDGLLAITE